jgi:nucleoid DNA-binding protein
LVGDNPILALDAVGPSTPTLEVRDREARTGRNPAKGEVIQLAASKKVAFRPAMELKEAV